MEPLDALNRSPDGWDPPRVVIVGSLNVDHTWRLPAIVKPGETRMASEVFTSFGGKGANQAVAALKSGAKVDLVGCVGNDMPGSKYVEYLREIGVGVGALIRRDLPTGAAFIQLDGAGENAIVVNSGANGTLSAKDVESAGSLITEADVLLVQLEVPFEAVCAAVSLARSRGVTVILNASPISEAYLQRRLLVDKLVVNEQEARALIGPSIDLSTEQGPELFDRLKCSQLVITRASKPTFCFEANRMVSAAPPRVDPVDTVGAGDAFTGAFAAASARFEKLDDVLRFSNAAGALTTLREGAQTALPTREEILKLAQRT